MFADDTTIILSANTIEDLYNLAQRTMDQINKYMNDNHMYLNCDKTKYMVIEDHKYDCTKDIFLHNTVLERKSDFKLLGYYIDSSLKFSCLTDTIIAKLNKYLYIFYRIRNLLTIHSKKLLFNAFVGSIINYNILFLTHANKKSLSNVNNIYVKCKKCLFNQPNISGIINSINDYIFIEQFKISIHSIINPNYTTPHTLNKPLFHTKVQDIMINYISIYM